MRKQFLLLLWLTLLPLASWAADPTVIWKTGKATEEFASGSTPAFPNYVTVINGEGKALCTSLGLGTTFPSGAGSEDKYYYNVYENASSSTPITTSPLPDGNYVLRLYIHHKAGGGPGHVEDYTANLPFTVLSGKTEVEVKLYSITEVWDDPWTKEPTIDLFNSTAELRKVTGANWDDVKGYLDYLRVENGTDVGSYSYTLTAQTNPSYIIHIDDAAAKLNITQATNVAGSVSLDDWTYGETAKTPVATGFKYGNDLAEFTYSVDNVTYGDYATIVNGQAGNYYVKATVPETINYTEASATKTFKINPYELVAGTDFDAPTAKTNGVYTGSAQDIAIAGAFKGTFAEELATAGAKFIYPTAEALPQQTNANENYSFSWNIDLGTSTNFSYPAGATTVSGAKIAKAFIISDDYTLPEVNPDLEAYNATNQDLHTALVWNVTPAPGEAHYGRNDTPTQWPTTIRWRNDAGTWTISTAIIPDANHTFEDGTYSGTVTIGGQTAYIVQNDLEVTIEPADLTITNPGSVVTNNVFDGTAQGLVATAPTFSGPGATNVAGTVTYAWNDGESDQTATNLANVEATNAGEYAITYTFVPGSNNFAPITEAQPLGGAEAKAKIEQFTLYVGGNEVTGTIEDVYDLENETPLISNSDFLNVEKIKTQFPAADADGIANAAAILDQLVAPVESLDDIIASATVATNTVALKKVDVAPAPGAPMNYKIDEATLLSNAASLTITAKEAAIQEDPEGDALTYNGADQRLIKKAAVGYKANGGAGSVAIGEVVYSLIEDGTYTNDPDEITAKAANQGTDKYTVYYKVELSKEATSLDRFYEYTGGVKSFEATIGKKELALAMFTFSDDDMTEVYTGGNLKPTVTAFDAVAGDAEKNALTEDDFTVTVTNSDGDTEEGDLIDVDTYTFAFTAKADGNYKDPATAVTADFEITEKALTADMFALSDGVTYNGEPQQPTITAADGESTPNPLADSDWKYEIKDGKGNVVKIDEMVNADTYTFTFTADGGNYQDAAEAITKTFVIAPKALAAGMFVFDDDDMQAIYNFNDQKPSFELLSSEPITDADYDLAISYKNTKDEVSSLALDAEFVNAGTYTFAFTGKGNYTTIVEGEETPVTIDFVINKKDQDVVAPKKINLTYNGALQTLVEAGSTDAEGLVYAIGDGEFGELDVLPEAKDAGTYTVKYAYVENDNFNAAEGGEVEVTIERATIGYMLGGMTKVWDGEPITEEANAEQLEKVFTIFAGELFEGDIYDVPFTLALPEDYRDAREHTFSAAQAEEGVQFKEGYPVNYKINFTGTGSVMIKKADIADGDYTAPTAVAADLTYINGTAQALVTAGEVTAKTAEDYPNKDIAGLPFGTIMYAVTDGEATTAPAADSEAWTDNAELAVGEAAGDYKVWYYVKGDINHNDTEPVKIEKSIAPKVMTFALQFETAEVEYTSNDNMPADILAYDGEIALTEADYDVTINGEAITEETKLINAGIYEFAYTGKGNYEGSSAAATITVGKAPLTAEMIPAYTESVTYDGKDHKFELALEAEGLTTADYTTAATEGEWINAGEYTFTFTAAEEGNYSGEITATFTIEKKEVIAQAADATKVYDGLEGFSELPVMTYVGLVPGEEDSFATDGAFTIEESSANVGTYTFTIDPEKLIATPDNYQVTAANGGTFTITPAPLMVNWNTEAEPFSKEYGAEDPTLNPEGKLSLTGAIAGEEDAIIAGTVITRAEGEEVGEYAVTLAADAAAEVFANYDVEFTGYDKGFVITPATVKISIVALEKVYDAKAATIEVKAEDLIVTGLKSGDKVEDIFTDLPTATVADGEAVNVGDYEVTLAGAVAGDYEFEYIPSSFKITPATITAATIAEQKVQQGKKLDETAFTIEGVAEGDEEYFYITSKYADFNGVVTGAAGIYEGALVIGIDDAVVDNYTGYEAFSGDLVIISAEAVVLADTEACAPAEDQNGVTVTFGDRNINAGTWNVVALPFAASVAQISEAFGYAAVDVLNEEANDGNIHFNLISSGEVPAYTPFIVKTTEDTDLKKTNFNQVVFYNVDIKAGEGENTFVKDGANNKFWGTFQETTTFYGQEFWYMSKGEWKDARNYSESNPVSLKPYRAYIEFDPANVAAGARVFVEEPDGTVTAIDAATFNKQINEGMYNLNGMKVNNANRKGVYIQNGKKVVK